MKYDLSAYPSSYYLEQFKEEAIRILPYREKGQYQIVDGKLVKASNDGRGRMWLPEQTEQGLFKIKTESFDLCLFLESKNSKIDDMLIDVAKELLANIVELDAMARAGRATREDDIHFANIIIKKESVQFVYVGAAVNVDFGVNVAKEPGGSWKCLEF